MSNSEIDNTIAKVLRWRDIHFYEDNAGPGIWNGIPPITEEESFKMSETELYRRRTYGEKIPNYCEDLNACHEMEKALTREQQFEYHNFIFDLSPCDENHGPVMGDDEDVMTPSGFTMLHASAEIRCKAFLKTVGKWKESE